MMKEEYCIREIEKKDVAYVIELVRNSFVEEYLIPSIYRSRCIEKFITNELDNLYSPYKYFVYCEESRILGYAEFKIYGDVGFLNIISTDNQYKGNGIGRKLFEYSKNYFKKHGFSAIQLDVYQSNTVAYNWYSKLGFKSVSSNSLYRLNFDEKDDRPVNFVIQNFPQYKEAINVFGFYFLDVKTDLIDLRYGVIENDLFIRQKYSESIELLTKQLLKKMRFNAVYYTGEKLESNRHQKINNIIRLELNIL